MRHFPRALHVLGKNEKLFERPRKPRRAAALAAGSSPLRSLGGSVSHCPGRVRFGLLGGRAKGRIPLDRRTSRNVAQNFVSPIMKKVAHAAEESETLLSGVASHLNHPLARSTYSSFAFYSRDESRTSRFRFHCTGRPPLIISSSVDQCTFQTLPLRERHQNRLC
jgi:hypothetical protein